MNLKKNIGLFFFIKTVTFLTGQPVHMPISASDPYGIDFSRLSGNVVQVSEYRGTDIDTLSLRTLSTYENSNPVTVTQYENSDSPRVITRYSYSEQGTLRSITGSDANGALRWKYEYTYDKNGQQIEEKSYNAANSIEGRITSKYTAAGNIRERLTYNEKDELMLKETFQYNDRGFISADITQYPDGKLLKRTIYTYTRGGHIADETHYDGGGLYERIGYTYTDGGLLTSFSNVGKDSVVNTRTTIQYDMYGKIYRQTIMGKDKSVTVITYIYDNYGNWVWKNDGSSYILRKIIYGQQ
jgi:hypothetical protein